MDISFLSAVGKLYGRVLIYRIRTRTDGVLEEKQCGFKSGRGCIDQLFVMRQLCEKFLAKGNYFFSWLVLRLYGVGG